MNNKIKRLLKNRIFLVVATIIICMNGTVLAVATYYSNKLLYKPADGTFNAANIKEALDILHEMAKSKFISAVAQKLLDNNATYGNYTYMGGTYLKGVQPNNYVWYNGYMWRIMGKNSDGTVRLIADENITSISWASTNTKSIQEYNIKEGYINDWLNDYFYSHLNETKNIIQDSTWCLNMTTSNNSTRTDCTGGTTFNAKIGLISVDEYNLSGASQTNKTYYLVSDQYYWTLTSYSTSLNVNSAWIVIPDGRAFNQYASVLNGVRPVINVSATARITVGDGTPKKPYILEQKNISATNKTLNEKVTSGEYVMFSNKTYRVISKESQGIKLIFDGYYEVTPKKTTYVVYNTSSSNVFAGSTIDIALNEIILTWLNSDKIIDASWNQGAAYSEGYQYTIPLSNNGSDIIRKVGLIKIGEVLAGQSGTMLTKNYTVASDYSNVRSSWTMTPSRSGTGVWVQNSDSRHKSFDSRSYAYVARPVVYVSGNNTITRGNGTPSSPYEI